MSTDVSQSVSRLAKNCRVLRTCIDWIGGSTDDGNQLNDMSMNGGGGQSHGWPQIMVMWWWHEFCSNFYFIFFISSTSFSSMSVGPFTRRPKASHKNRENSNAFNAVLNEFNLGLCCPMTNREWKQAILNSKRSVPNSTISAHQTSNCSWNKLVEL